MTVLLFLATLFFGSWVAILKAKLLIRDRKLAAIQDVVLLDAKYGATHLSQTVHGILNGSYT